MDIKVSADFMNNSDFPFLTRILIENTIEFMRIIVRMPNWIGDCILSLPALADIGKSFPEAEIWLACHERVANIFSEIDLIEKTIILKDQISFKSIKESSRELKKYKFDIGILFTNSFASALLFYTPARQLR